jgi:hypothetical protein
MVQHQSGKYASRSRIENWRLLAALDLEYHGSQSKNGGLDQDEHRSIKYHQRRQTSTKYRRSVLIRTPMQPQRDQHCLLVSLLY